MTEVTWRFVAINPFRRVDVFTEVINPGSSCDKFFLSSLVLGFDTPNDSRTFVRSFASPAHAADSPEPVHRLHEAT